MENIYQAKYYKYKQKYLNLQAKNKNKYINLNLKGGGCCDITTTSDSVTSLSSQSCSHCNHCSHNHNDSDELNVKIVTLDTCGWCIKAKELLNSYNIPFCESAPDENFKFKTVPQIWIDDIHIGGYEDLKKYFDELLKKENEDLLDDESDEDLLDDESDENVNIIRNNN